MANNWVDLGDPDFLVYLEILYICDFAYPGQSPKHCLQLSLHMEHEITFLQKTSLLVQFGWWTPPLARFWHVTLVERSQHCKYRKGGDIPMTSPFHRMNRSLPDNNHSETCQLEGKGQFPEISNPTTHSFNHGSQHPEKITLLNHGCSCSHIMQNKLSFPRGVWKDRNIAII